MKNIAGYSEARARLVEEPIAASDAVEDVEAEFDLDAIAAEVLVWDDAYDAEADTYWLDNQGWRYAKGFGLDDEFGDAFWGVVGRHAVEGGA